MCRSRTRARRIRLDDLRRPAVRATLRAMWTDPLPQKPLSLAFAIPDHPWVDGSDGATARIAITVGK